MIMTNSASPAVLDRYADGIRDLVRIHPSSWGVIFLADELNRFERWDQISEDLLDGPEADRLAVGLTEDRPWNVVIRLSTFGQTNNYSHWWFLHVLSVCGSGSRTASAAMLEGSDKFPDFSNPGRRGGSQATKSKKQSGASSSNNSNNRRTKGVCFNWNGGGCVAGFTCPQGFKHECRDCRGTHRQADCPDSKPKGKGKKGGGGKGSKGGSKGKKGSGM
jgi:hypothetical protein